MDPVILGSFFVIALQGAIAMLFWRPSANSHKQLRPKKRLAAAVIATAITLITCLLDIYYINSFYRMGSQINLIGLVVCIVSTPIASVLLYLSLSWIQQKVDGILNRLKPRA